MAYVGSHQWHKPRAERGYGPPQRFDWGDRVSYMPPMFNQYENEETLFLMNFYFHH